MFRFNIIKQDHGFGLIEIMIASLVLGVSLLGIASMQSKSLSIAVESDRNETAYRMINQLANFALNAEPPLAQYMADSGIGASEISLCYDPTNPCDKQTFYKTTVKEWQSILSTMFPEGQGCTCIQPLSSTAPAGSSAELGTSTPSMSLRISIRWRTLSGSLSTVYIDTAIPGVDTTNINSTTVTCPVGGTTICAFT